MGCKARQPSNPREWDGKLGVGNAPEVTNNGDPLSATVFAAAKVTGEGQKLPRGELELSSFPSWRNPRHDDDVHVGFPQVS